MRNLPQVATNFSDTDWNKYLLSIGEPGYRSLQIRKHLFQLHTRTFSEMTNLPKQLRLILNETLLTYGLKEHSKKKSADNQTTKVLLKTYSDEFVESVSIKENTKNIHQGSINLRHTVCVSSQIGCAMRCVFCASGISGLSRNLSTGEILDQVVIAKRDFGPVNNIVFMGMGEPLANLKEVIPAIKILCSKDFFGLSPRRITVSTVGLVSGINKLINLGLPLGLAISLHAPDDQLRHQLVPTSKNLSIHEIIYAANRYSETLHRTITFEYVLLKGINDSHTHARKLVNLVKKLRCKVNLIPYNKVDDYTNLKRPSTQAIVKFSNILKQNKLQTTIRKEKGADVAAACGQLRSSQTKNDTLTLF